jgi:hypothetical protein
VLCDGQGVKIQVNLWGEDLIQTKLQLSDRILVAGARTTDKYGKIQVNLNSNEGKITVNPKGYKTLEKTF